MGYTTKKSGGPSTIEHLSGILAFPGTYQLEDVIPNHHRLTIVMHSQMKAACCPVRHHLATVFTVIAGVFSRIYRSRSGQSIFNCK
jgi:hypothetical protein